MSGKRRERGNGMQDRFSINQTIAELEEAKEHGISYHGDDGHIYALDSYEHAIGAGLSVDAAEAIDNYGGLEDAIENLIEDRDQ